MQEDVDDLDLARHLLNKQQYEEAIDLLKQLLKGRPANNYVRILLASAYAGSVGINTIDSFDALRNKLFDKPIVGGLESSSSIAAIGSSRVDGPTKAEEDSPASDDQIIEKFEREMLQFFSVARDAFEIGFHLPHTALEERNRLVKSLNILKEINVDHKEYAIGQLYIAILSIVQFLNYFRDAVPHAKTSGEKDWYLNLYCNLDIGKFFANLSESSQYLSKAFDSLISAGRRSDNPVYSNLETVKNKLVTINGFYLSYHDVFNLTDFGHQLSKHAYCN